MKITEKWLQDRYGCHAGVRWLKEQKNREVFAVLEALMKEHRYEWTFWMLSRLMPFPVALRYTMEVAKCLLRKCPRSYPGKCSFLKAVRLIENRLLGGHLSLDNYEEEAECRYEVARVERIFYRRGWSKVCAASDAVSVMLSCFFNVKRGSRSELSYIPEVLACHRNTKDSRKIARLGINIFRKSVQTKGEK